MIATFTLLNDDYLTDKKLWIELTWLENSANTYAQHTETLDSFFDLIRSHQQCIPWFPPLEIELATTDCRAETLQLSHQTILHLSDAELTSHCKHEVILRNQIFMKEIIRLSMNMITTCKVDRKLCYLPSILTLSCKQRKKSPMMCYFSVLWQGKHKQKLDHFYIDFFLRIFWLQVDLNRCEYT